MSFFSYASGVNINGGTFYSSARDVNIQNSVQLAIENESQALVYADGPEVHGHHGAQNVIEDRRFAGPQRSGGYAPRTERFLRTVVDISARRGIASRSDPHEYGFLHVMHAMTPGGAIDSPTFPTSTHPTPGLSPEREKCFKPSKLRQQMLLHGHTKRLPIFTAGPLLGAA
ncbi:hypothetical protein B0H13DRAFT_2327144 [Mycena leptocephala]|nr:hypothetical protein B0H13DRAFT_2327144 [Mycena leptocephala]